MKIGLLRNNKQQPNSISLSGTGIGNLDQSMS